MFGFWLSCQLQAENKMGEFPRECCKIQDSLGLLLWLVIPGSSEQWLAVFPSDPEMKSLVNESGLALYQ